RIGGPAPRRGSPLRVIFMHQHVLCRRIITISAHPLTTSKTNLAAPPLTSPNLRSAPTRLHHWIHRPDRDGGTDVRAPGAPLRLARSRPYLRREPLERLAPHLDPNPPQTTFCPMRRTWPKASGLDRKEAKLTMARPKQSE